MHGQIRQGDILLVPVEVSPPLAIETKTEVVLAEGESTGHAHRLAGPAVLDWTANGQRYVRIAGTSPGTLAHEDHDPIPAPVVEPETTYQVVRQRQLSLAEEWAQVRD